jgi:hypothetical protein
MLPVLLMPLCRRVSPVDLSDGTRARGAIYCRGGSKRRRSPASAITVAAVVKATPRCARNAATTGAIVQEEGFVPAWLPGGDPLSGDDRSIQAFLLDRPQRRMGKTLRGQPA